MTPRRRVGIGARGATFAIESLLATPRLTRVLLGALVAIIPLALLFASETLESIAVAVATAGLAAAAFAAFDRSVKGSNSRGYEILEQEHEWDLVRPDGSLVIHRKRLRVRYLNQTISMLDFAWGEGDLFAEYSCDPGRVVDRFAADGQLWVLISLGRPRQRGEIEELTFRRAISDGFLGPSEWIEASTEGTRVSLKVVFPKDRPPETLEVVRRQPSLLGRPVERREALPRSALDEVSQRKIAYVDTRSSSPDATLVVRWSWPAIGVFVSHSPANQAAADRLASYLRERGLTVQTSADRVTAERSSAASVANALAIVLVVDSEPAGDRLRSEWSAALDKAWSPEPRPVAVLLVGGAHAPGPLQALPGFALPAEPQQWTAAFERLRKAIWEPGMLIREADVKPARELDRPAVRETLDRSRGDEEAQATALARELARRRESLEEELERARRVEDQDAIRQGAYALGITLSHLDELEPACEMLELAIAIAEREFGESHPMVADGTYNLAMAYARRGRTQEATRLLERTAALGEATLGSEHPKARVYRTALEKIAPPPAGDST